MARGGAIILILLVLAFAIFAGWYSGQRRDYFPESLHSAFGDCEVTPKKKDRQQVLDPFQDEWYSGALSAFDEPSLFDRPRGALRSVRFTWLRSFHPAVVVRIDTTDDGTLRLTAKQRSDVGFDERGGVQQDKALSRELTPIEAAGVERMLKESGLFRSNPSGCTRGVDGARWLVEGSDPRFGYRYRNNQIPSGGGLERTVGLHLLGLTGWTFDPVY